MHLASIFFCLFQLVNSASDLEDPFPPKTQGINSCNYLDESFLWFHVKLTPWKSSLALSLVNASLNTREKYVWRTITHWPASSSSGLLENFYKQPYLRDLSLFIICRGKGAGAGVKGSAGEGLCWSHDYLIPLYIFMIPTLPLSFPIHWHSILVFCRPSLSGKTDSPLSLTQKPCDPPKFSTYRAINNDKSLS